MIVRYNEFLRTSVFAVQKREVEEAGGERYAARTTVGNSDLALYARNVP